MQDTPFDKKTAYAWAQAVSAYSELIRSGRLRSISPLLPGLLRFENAPFTLNQHPQMEPMFRVQRSRVTTWLCARQIGKSIGQGADMSALAALIPGFRQLYVAPLFEHVRRFSNNVVRTMIADSPVRALLTNSKINNSVLQKTFLNESLMLFTFAGTDPTRTRGATADLIRFDELQSMDRASIPIIKATSSHSHYRLVVNTGTPLTLDTAIAVAWNDSSQAEWFIPCRHCRAWNIPSTEHHLDQMIGPWHADISEKCPGLVCAKCRKPVFPTDGVWVHRKTDLEKQAEHSGYHMPQPVLLHHCTRPDAWKEIIRVGKAYSRTQYVNEILGESTDFGAKLISETDLRRAASLPWKNNPARIEPHIVTRLEDYPVRLLSVDWSGGGESETSTTAVVLLGQRPDGHIDALWGTRLSMTTGRVQEAQYLKYYLQYLQCHYLVHDYTGAGAVREDLLIQAGVNPDQIMPIAYIRTALQQMMIPVPPTAINPRTYYRLDKARSLVFTTEAIKLGLISFFEWDYSTDIEPGLISDFLSLVEQKIETRLAGDNYLITKKAGSIDDFAQAVNIGCAALWYLTRSWPQFNEVAEYLRLTEGQEMAFGSDRFTFVDEDL